MTQKYNKGDIFKNVSREEKNAPIVADNSPHDDISENGVVGSVILNAETILHCENLKPNMFFNIELGTIYDIVYQLINKDGVTKIDDYTILSKVEGEDSHKKNLQKYSTKEIRDLLDKLRRVGTSDINEYIRRCENVMNMDFRRKGSVKLREIATSLESDFTDDINTANIKLQDNVMKLSEEYLMENGVKLISEVIDEAWDEIESRRDGNTTVGLPSKFATINDFFTYEKGELVIVGGRARLWLAS